MLEPAEPAEPQALINEDEHNTSKHRRYSTHMDESFWQQALTGTTYLFAANKSIYTVLLYSLVVATVAIFLECSYVEFSIIAINTCIQFLCEALVCCMLIYVLAEDQEDIVSMLAAISLGVHALTTIANLILIINLLINKE